MALAGCSTYLEVQGASVERRDPDSLSAMLKPAYRSFRPSGPGPFPTAILASGCDGPKDNLDRWATMLVERGWAALIVDSHGPRGYDAAQRWRLVCAGQILTGGERAGDIAVAIEDARKLEFVDPDRILLMGASHGGWAILDMLALHARGRTPYNLSRWPDSLSAPTLEGFAGAILLYPYCGVASQVRRAGWRGDLPALFLLVEGDTIVDEEACHVLAESMAARGAEVDVHLLRGTTHGFDQVEKSAFSRLEFSPDALSEAQAVVTDFLARQSKAPDHPGRARGDGRKP
ncbi:dienelactone hydrolase family protein [Aliiruegeria haliotis]|uniref:dienelactone hydrolase family protein n=1 Tax=Aliiruegeria haliotis TaxID=1280846 RepID=UPI001B801B0F|nr:dienelactone hydrolase family protein [Aliiruegeria haliotis]